MKMHIVPVFSMQFKDTVYHIIVGQGDSRTVLQHTTLIISRSAISSVTTIANALNYQMQDLHHMRIDCSVRLILLCTITCSPNDTA